MLNKQAINEVLSKAPLCHGFLMRDAGMTREYCAMGALGKACGVSDAELQQMDGGGSILYETIKVQLREKFGIETLLQFQSLMNANDSVESPIERKKVVLNRVEALSCEQVNELLKETNSVSAEFGK